jgi:hypothetical protein
MRPRFICFGIGIYFAEGLDTIGDNLGKYNPMALIWFRGYWKKFLSES